MRAVKGKNTTPELMLRKMLHRAGYRYRLHRRDLPGKPDIVFPGRKKVIFVHGCFWHGHDCHRGARLPKTNAAYWNDKISRNRKRDAVHLAALREMGWEALVIWECELSDMTEVMQRAQHFLDSPQTPSPRQAPPTS